MAVAYFALLIGALWFSPRYYDLDDNDARAPAALRCGGREWPQLAMAIRARCRRARGHSRSDEPAVSACHFVVLDDCRHVRMHWDAGRRTLEYVASPAGCGTALIELRRKPRGWRVTWLDWDDNDPC
jgi:hypothetical protein